MADLKTNYVDDVLDTTKNQLRKYQQIQNDDGTVSFVDVTEYTQVGTSFGAKDINDTNAAINDVNGKLGDLMIIKTYTSSSAITFIPGWGNISNNLFDIDIPSGYREIERHFESPGYNIAIFYTNNGSNPMYYSKHPSSDRKSTV